MTRVAASNYAPLPKGTAPPAPVRRDAARESQTSKSALELPPLVAEASGSQFYKRAPETVLNVLLSSRSVVLRVGTTATTRHSKPLRISATTLIGDIEWPQYRAIHPTCNLNSSPRVRVLGVYAEGMGCCAWDLDALGREERDRLLTAALDGKIVVGHNVGTDLAWLFQETAARPSFVLDTMLLLRQMNPKVFLRPYKMAASADPVLREMGEYLLRNDDPSSITFAASCLQLSTPDAAYEAATNWSVSVLSPGHLKYIEDSLRLPLTFLTTLMPGVPVEHIPGHLRDGFPWYLPYQSALMRLAEAHARGVPFDRGAAVELKDKLTADLNQAADRLMTTSEFSDFDIRLHDPHMGENDDLRQALANYANERSVMLPRSALGKPRTDKYALRASGADQLPACVELATIQSAKQRILLVEGYERAAKGDGRLHPIVNFTAVTGRASSIEPNLQGMPRDPCFRSLVRARPGHAILSADYSAIELRIAAVLADRAIADVRSRIEGGEDSWFLRQVAVGLRASNRPPYPEEPPADTRPGIEWNEAVLHSISYTVLHRQVQVMESIFQLGLDPHLVTAMDLARRSGRVDFEGHPLHWLGEKDGLARIQLKERFGEERQAAKAANFGLLYGMQARRLHNYGATDFGLSWTLAEASDTRRAWFELYPEFQFWHEWTKHCQSRKLSKDSCRVWGRGPASKELVSPSFDMKLFTPTALTGRPFVVLDDLGQALNYQDQGSGADILARAISGLPPEIASMMLMSVHDELVFEVPSGKLPEVQQIVESVMTAAAVGVLGSSIPIEVKSATGETWS